MATRALWLTLLTTLSAQACINESPAPISEGSTDDLAATATDGNPSDSGTQDAAGDTGPPDPLDSGEGPNIDAGLPPDVNTDPPPTACADEDDLAPNQSLGEPAPIEVGFVAGDLYLCPESQDFFALDLAAGDRIVIQAAAQPEDNDIDLVLFDEAGEVLTQSAGAAGVESMAYTAVDAGRVIIQVTGGFHDLETRYALGVTSTCRLDADCLDGEICSPFAAECIPLPDVACGEDDFEENDLDAQAFPVDVDGPVLSASICAADPDWYLFRADGGDTLDVLLSFPEGLDLDVFVRDLLSGGIVGAATGDQNANPERLRLRHLPAGDYAVGVVMADQMNARNEVDYRLDVARTAGLCVADLSCDGSRPTCDLESGTCVRVPEAGAVPIGGQCGTTADCGDAESVCQQGGPGGGDNFCSFACEMDGDCGAVGDGAYCQMAGGGATCARPCADDGGCSETRSCQDGRCVRRAMCQANSDCAEGEICRVNFTGRTFCGVPPVGAACGVDASPNDSSERATRIELDALIEGLSICNSDDDYFVVAIPPAANGDTLHAVVTFREGVDIDVYVQDAALRVVGGAVSGDMSTEDAVVPFIGGGDYFIRVDQFASDGLDDTTYTLTARLEAVEGGCVDDAACIASEPPRAVCDVATGACGFIEGAGSVALGGLCDSDDDCVEGTELCWIFEGSDGVRAGVNICTHQCGDDADCEDAPGTTCTAFNQGQVAVCLPPR